MKTKGFITIATGKEEYYILANNLLHSYQLFTEDPLPFAILCDRENEFTKDFDNVIIFPNGATNSYLDKLSLNDFLPYDINIFIDSDCLVYDDLNVIFEQFEDADDFSAFGRVLPADSKTGWFELANIGSLIDRVSYTMNLHGGIYFIRKGDIANKVLEDARSFVSNYNSFKFKGKFDTPGDEPLVALAMAANNCHTIPFNKKYICCYWEYVDKMKLDIVNKIAQYGKNKDESTILTHFGTRYTRELEYQEQVALLKILESKEYTDSDILECKQYYLGLIKRRNRSDKLRKLKRKIKQHIK